MSVKRISLVQGPPPFILNEFARQVAEGAHVVVPVVVMVDKLEAYVSNEVEDIDIVRAFIDVKQAKAYWAYVSNHTGLPDTLANFWVTDPEGLIVHLSGLAKTRKRKIKCYSSAIHENRIFDLETFWTNDQKLMV